MAHETRHAWQKLWIPEVFNDECRAEGDAYPYAYAVLKRYLGARDELTDVVREDINKMRTEAEKRLSAGCPGTRFEIIHEGNSMTTTR